KRGLSGNDDHRYRPEDHPEAVHLDCVQSVRRLLGAVWETAEAAGVLFGQEFKKTQQQLCSF
ncbi:MAG: hypothetical protein IIW95_03695, partial [Lachnospiraceae bacterium]|nr:hypothetical protein [Lachnospiraceae bacterium]